MIHEFHEDGGSNHNIGCSSTTRMKIFILLYVCVFLIILLLRTIIIKKLYVTLHSYCRILYEDFIFIYT